MGFSQLQKKSGFVLLSDKGQQSSNEYVTLVDKNGLIQVVPRKKKSVLSTAPLRLIVLFFLLITVFKALAVLNVGITTYEEQLTALPGGNVVEQAGAFVLSVDPLTHTIIQGIEPLVR